ncbi:hypothetical protein [Streptosporangium sp. NPDC087985]
MSTHVHVRIAHGLAMTEEGDLVELKRCRCGAEWTTTYWTEDGDLE